MYIKLQNWLKLHYKNFLRSLTTKKLFLVFFTSLIALSLIAVFSNPQGMMGSITANFIVLCAGAILIELMFIARDEQKISDYESQQNRAVSLLLVRRTSKGPLLWYVSVFSVGAHLRLDRIKNISLHLKFNKNGGHSMSSVKIMEGEFSTNDLALKPLADNEELDGAIKKCKQEPDELVLQWTDEHNTHRQRSWTLSEIRKAQRWVSKNDQPFSVSLS